MRFEHEKDGDTTPWRRRFAWWPVYIQDTASERLYTIWWEHYMQREVYTERERMTKFGFPIVRGGWDVERLMIDKT